MQTCATTSRPGQYHARSRYGRNGPPTAPGGDCDISEYRLMSLSTDILSFLSSLEINTIDLLVGHDAGSSVAGVSAMIRPDIFRSVVMMSAPYTGAPDIKTDSCIEDPIHHNLENLPTPKKHYQWYYSTLWPTRWQRFREPALLLDPWLRASH